MSDYCDCGNMYRWSHGPDETRWACDGCGMTGLTIPYDVLTAYESVG